MTTDTRPDRIDLMAEYESLREALEDAVEDRAQTALQMRSRAALNAFVSHLIALAEAGSVAQKR